MVINKGPERPHRGNAMKKKILLVAVFVAFFGLGALYAQSGTILFINDTNEYIINMYVRPSGTGDWGPNLIPQGNYYAPWSSYVITLGNVGNGSNWDLRFQDNRGNWYTNVNLWVNPGQQSTHRFYYY